MSYPKDRCDKECQFAKYDKDYNGVVCEYPGDFTEARVDPKVPKDCPWVAWWDEESEK